MYSSIKKKSVQVVSTILARLSYCKPRYLLIVVNKTRADSWIC
jgi:hypothetical protein